MDIAKEIFGKKRVVRDRLESAGFILTRPEPDRTTGSADEPGRTGGGASEPTYSYSETFRDGGLTAIIKIFADGSVSCSVVDAESGDAYLPMNIEAYTGSYVGQAREEYKALLERVADACFTDVPFISDQANRITSKISAEFDVQPEFPFTVKGKDKEAVRDTDTAVFRHKDTGKWFAIIMTIAGKKLEGYGGATVEDSGATAEDSGAADEGFGAGGSKKMTDPDERINVMNIKIYPEKLEVLLGEPGLYRCYHMNKKQWLSIALDDEATDDRIMELLGTSFSLTRGGSLVRRRGSTRLVGRSLNGDSTVFEENGDRRYWLIPSNPANFDVAKGFRDSGNDTLAWHHRINVMPGDIVYIYQTEPVASIMWECEVLESYMPRPAGWENFAPNSKYRMTLKRLRSFKKGEYPRSWLNEHGVAKTVRGQRSAPDELVQAMRTDKTNTHP